MNRVKRVKNQDYTTISNVFLRDKRLSLKAKGFLAVIMSLPEDWDFSIKGICSILKEGSTAIYSTIDELKEYGYCFVERERDERGYFSGSDYIFLEQPHIDSPHKECPYAENPNVDNQAQIKKEENKEKRELNKEYITPKRNEYAEDFERAFVLYERKGSKADAYKRWLKLTDEEKELVFKHIPHYLSAHEVQYRKDFSGYLNQKYFNNVVYKNNVIIYDPNATHSLFPTKEKTPTLAINGQIYR